MASCDEAAAPVQLARTASAGGGVDGADFVVIDRLHGLKTLSESLRLEVDCLHKDVLQLRENMDAMESLHAMQEKLWKCVRWLVALVLPLLGVFVLDVSVLQIRALRAYRGYMQVLSLGTAIGCLIMVLPGFVIAWTEIDDCGARLRTRLRKLLCRKSHIDSSAADDLVKTDDTSDQEGRKSDLNDVQGSEREAQDEENEEEPEEYDSDEESVDGRPQDGRGDGAALEDDDDEDIDEEEDDEEEYQPEITL